MSVHHSIPGAAGFAFLLALSLTGCSQLPQQTGTTTLAPFTTDGCSLFPDRWPGTPLDWCDCCVAHDRAYWRGGTADERQAADQALQACVRAKTASPALAALMYAGVRLGGTPHLDTPFRWAYGWPFGRGYAPLTQAEAEQAAQREQAYQAAHSAAQTCPP